MKTLGQPNAAFAGDHGHPDPELRSILATAYDGGTNYHRAIAALCTARLLLPIVAAGDEGEPGSGPDPDRHAEMAAVLVRSDSGATAVPVFTGIDSLNAWKPDARPVPCTLDDVAATAVETKSAAVVIDLPGPHPLVIEAGVIDELAQGHRLVELPDGGFGWMYLDREDAGDDHGH
ncbi:SseB family protein [Propioniciclava sp. MC1595]|uniref:SseB family protein n=1 Tax=unclassified Propioniciclava TaxID=2642922 RepID=UPI0016032C75|nr:MULTISPECIES: SseB family protein [unclassified Propioniciclava]MBB1496299.1 SseB family protein [Propioniciclava sp. MC1595]MBB1502678.1 SseB family protein [Propioniciclava sp. MC1683]NLE16985.1 SseB family protein [Propioniciclava sp.]QTE24867.1 SseB family protein [Propioniciclava sp. MC1595]